MSSVNEARQATMDVTQIYREETFTDRKVGTIRKLTPVTSDGGVDTTRPVIFVGQAQVMTPMGALPISFELEAATLDVAVEKFGSAASRRGSILLRVRLRWGLHTSPKTAATTALFST